MPRQTCSATDAGADAGAADAGADTSPNAGADPCPEVALVPRGAVFEGQLAVVVGTTRVDGTVLGSLQGPGDLILGPEARVEGRIECASVSSRGAVLGAIVVRKHLHLGEGARFEGDLKAPAVEVDGDVVWNGKAEVSR